MQDSSKESIVELRTSLQQDDSLAEAAQTPETQAVTLLYDEELNRQQLKLLNYSLSEMYYLALSIFVDPCIIKANHHILIKAFSVIMYFGQGGGYAVFTYGFIQNNFPMIGIYLLLTIGSFLSGIAFRIMLIFSEKTILKTFLLRAKMRKVFRKSEECINEISYPFTLTLKAISEELEPETTYNWNLLTPHYKQNLSNVIPSSDEFQRACEDFLEWKHKSNGCQLLYAMTAYKFTVKTLYHAGMAILMMIAAGMAAIGFIVVNSIVKYDIYGLCLRLDMFVTYGIAGLIVLVSSFSANHEYLMARPPEEFIKINKLYRRPEDRSFLIDVFSMETLETYMLNYFKIREMARHSTRNQEFPFLFLLVLTMAGTGFALGLVYSGWSEKELFGYGFTAIVMFTMIVNLLFVLILHLIIGALFNQRPLNMIKQLKKLKDLYIQMDKLRKGKYGMEQLGHKMQFLFECIEGKDVDFKALQKKVELIMEAIDYENQTSPYKFLSVFECTPRNIAGLLLGISSILSLALVKYTGAVLFLLENNFTK